MGRLLVILALYSWAVAPVCSLHPPPFTVVRVVDPLGRNRRARFGDVAPVSRASLLRARQPIIEDTPESAHRTQNAEELDGKGKVAALLPLDPLAGTDTTTPVRLINYLAPSSIGLTTSIAFALSLLAGIAYYHHYDKLDLANAYYFAGQGK
jgi:hypothetical protein